MGHYTNHKIYQKHIAWVYIIVLALGTIASLALPKEEKAAASEEILTIPDEAIRLRILANSDSERDQEVKRAIRDAVNQEITLWVEELTSLDEARTVISSHLQEVEQIANRELKARNLDYSVNVDFGEVQFPAKLYGNILYPAGTYEAILITLGEGSGANWWCVLFPPLCFLDFSNSVAVRDGFEEQTEIVDKPVDNAAATTFAVEKEEPVEVKFFLIEWFNRLF